MPPTFEQVFDQLFRQAAEVLEALGKEHPVLIGAHRSQTKTVFDVDSDRNDVEPGVSGSTNLLPEEGDEDSRDSGKGDDGLAAWDGVRWRPLLIYVVVVSVGRTTVLIVW